MFGMPYYRYYAFKSDASDMVRFKVRGEGDLKAKVLQKAKDYGVPVGEGDIQIWQTEEGGFRVKASWHEDVNILDIYKRRLSFGFVAG
jgi:uncharacterized cupin superfamily protein